MASEPVVTVEMAVAYFRAFQMNLYAEAVERSLAEKDAKIVGLEGRLKGLGELSGEQEEFAEELTDTIAQLEVKLAEQAQEIERFKREVERLVACHGPQLLARDKLLEQAKENCGEWSDIASGQSEQIALWRPVIQAATIQAEAADSGNRDYWLTATIKTEQAVRALCGKGGEDFEERGKG